MPTGVRTGGCQCGAVRFRAEVDIAETVACNCSRCGRLGLMLAFAPEARFALEAVENALTQYRFNKHVIHHLFCKVCGAEPFARGERPDGARVVAVNVRCLDGVDPNELSPTKIDGRSR